MGKAVSGEPPAVGGGKASGGTVSGVKLGGSEMGPLDLVTRRPEVTSKTSVSKAKSEGSGLRSEWERAGRHCPVVRP